MAAVHEAGHVVIARRVGFKIASAWIIPNAGEGHKRCWENYENRLKMTFAGVFPVSPPKIGLLRRLSSRSSQRARSRSYLGQFLAQ
jgi:hypothetical protein